MRTACFWLRALLLVNACMLVLAFPCVFFSFEWMSRIHAWLGMGSLPERPIVGYLARSLSAFYGFHGVLLFVLASDLKRYSFLITLVAGAGLVFGPVLLWIDVKEGMPLGWTLCEGPFVLVTGLALLVLQRFAQREAAVSPCS